VLFSELLQNSYQLRKMLLVQPEVKQ
jgi:hypothetical protein